MSHDPSTVTVYEKPTCTTCRDLVRLLEERGVPFERVDVHLDPLTAAQITDLLVMAGVGPREVLRAAEGVYAGLTDAALVEAMADEPDLLQRPIVVRGTRAVLARPAERVLALFEDDPR